MLSVTPTRAAGRVDPCDTAAFADEPRDFAVLDDIDAAVAGSTRITPYDRIVSCCPAASLQQSTPDRKPRILEVRVG